MKGDKKYTVRFLHLGEEHTYWTAVNPLTGDRLTAFDDNAPSINDSLKDIRAVIRNIAKSAEVISIEGEAPWKKDPHWKGKIFD